MYVALYAIKILNHIKLIIINFLTTTMNKINWPQRTTDSNIQNLKPLVERQQKIDDVPFFDHWKFWSSSSFLAAINHYSIYLEGVLFLRDLQANQSLLLQVFGVQNLFFFLTVALWTPPKLVKNIVRNHQRLCILYQKLPNFN